MAKATKTTIPPVPVKPISTITLTLSMKEAEALRSVLSFVGGEPKLSRRGLIDQIDLALSEAGVADGYPNRDVNRASGSGLYFKDIT